MARWQPLLDEVVRTRWARLLAYATVLTGSSTGAEDLVQDALVSTFVGRARFASVAQAEAYVRRAIASRYVDAVRRGASERRAHDRVVGHAPPAQPEPGSDLLDPTLRTALARLSPRERACVVLRHMEDLSVRETARLLGLSDGAVKRYVADGVARLNETLGSTVSERELVRTDVEVRDA